MGKGDKRTKRGKMVNRSYGNIRLKAKRIASKKAAAAKANANA